ncbi:MAG: TIGR03619 family F420-dependent LLM class oxidoreductase [Pseudomonadales bacterium]|nr:TIGR03619 family F420-dependent LLM class oxidoreductase [Pseudomonadales bacterium]
MKFALFGINTGPCAAPQTMLDVAKAAEASGFESVWTGEHVVLPDPQVPPSPAAPLTEMVHPSTALSYIAGATKTLKLGTGITLLAQRNAVVLAKEMASLDFLSQGRLIFGIGAGYLKQEFDALGVNFEERGARTDEYIEAMRELWTSDHPTFAGKFVRYSGIQSRPKPAQAGGPPVVVGGASASAFRRAVTKCQGWYGFAMDFDTAAKCLEGLEAASKKYERPASLGKLEISITPRMATGTEELGRWTGMGVDRLILLQRGRDRQALVDDVHRVADALIR